LLFLLCTIVIVCCYCTLSFLYCTFIMYPAIRLSSRKCAIKSVFSVDHDLVQCWRGLAAPFSTLFIALEETMNMFNKKQLHLYHVYALSLSAKYWHLEWDDMNEEATYSPVQTNLTLHSKIS